jgi:hypothetical protein
VKLGLENASRQFKPVITA